MDELYLNNDFLNNNNVLETVEINIKNYNKFVDIQNKKAQKETYNITIATNFCIYEKQTLKQMDDGYIFNINAIKCISTPKFGNTYLLLDLEHEKVIWANKPLISYINAIISKLFYNNKQIYHLEKYENILLVKKVKTVLSHGYYETKVDIKCNKELNLLTNTLKEELTEEKENILEFVDSETKEKDCILIDTLEEGHTYTIIGFIKKSTGKKTKYILKLKEKEGLYVSNTFLEEKIEQEGIIENKTIIKIGTIKTNKNKKKHRLVYY